MPLCDRAAVEPLAAEFAFLTLESVDLVEPAYGQIRPEFTGLHHVEDPLVDCHVLRALDLNPIVQEGSDLSESILSIRKSHDSIIAGTAGLAPSASAASGACLAIFAAAESRRSVRS